MIPNNLSDSILALKSKSPIIHCITNPISINQNANTILSQGARPIMAEHPSEVLQITKNADSLLLNTGNITDARKKSMLISAKAASQNQIPFVLDLVGISCSDFRRNLVHKIMRKAVPDIIKGNYSEIIALQDHTYRNPGVDAQKDITERNMCLTSYRLAQKYNTVVLASGKTDVISDGHRIFLAKNGTARLAQITGTGCMLGALCACYLAVCDSINAALNACHILGICAEMAEERQGNGTFEVTLMDKLSMAGELDMGKYIRLEETGFENL